MSILLAVAAMGASPELPASIAREAVRVPRARAAAGVDLTLDDFELTLPEGVTASWVPGSLEWVRLAGVVVVPRARIAIAAPGATQVRYEGFVTPLDDEGRAEVSVALLSDTALQVVSAESDEPIGWAYRGPFRSRRDVSCSGHRVVVEGGPEGTWASVGCRRTALAGRRGRDAVLDLVVTWSGSGETDLGPPVTTRTWAVRAPGGPGAVTISGQTGSLRMRYQIRRRDHDLQVGGVLGATYQPDSGRGTAPLGYARVYASYSLGPTAEVLVYEYANLHPRYFANDAGGYYQMRIGTFLDQRFEIRSLLGAHVQSFVDDGELHTKIGFPQGLEVRWVDGPIPDWHVSGGGFIGPPITGEWFANSYLRVGREAFFEIGFSGWAKEVPTTGRFVDQRLITVAVGGPIFRAL